VTAIARAKSKHHLKLTDSSSFHCVGVTSEGRKPHDSLQACITGVGTGDFHNGSVPSPTFLMYAPISLSQPLNVEQVIHQILALGRISRMDQDLLRWVGGETLTERERKLVKGLQNALCQGQLLVA